MLDALFARATRIADECRAALIDRLIRADVPPGITVSENEAGVVLSGQRLRHRLLTEAALRNFGR